MNDVDECHNASCESCKNGAQTVNLVMISGDLPLPLDRVPFRSGQVVRLHRMRQGTIDARAWRAWSQFWNQ